MRLILIRHGSTFEDNDKLVKAGIKEDRPLTKKGIEQILNFANTIKNKNISPKVVFTGVTSKSQMTADKIAETLGMDKNDIITDKRIDDFDYGSWSGLTDDEIIDKFGKNVLDNWEKNANIPDGCGFSPQESIVTYNLRSFCAEMMTRFKKDTVITVVNDGIVKFLYKILQDALKEKTNNDKKITIRNGHCADIQLKSLTNLRLDLWDVDASELESH